MNNKKGQIGIGTYGLIDASTLPKWILYPLLFFIFIILAIVSIVMILFIISWFIGDVTFMPFGMFGYYGMPIMVGSFSSHSSSSSLNQECFVNGIKIDCSNFTSDEHFCNNGVCEMNGVCGGDYQSNINCIKNLTR
jgi:hypothetical protein